MTKQFIKLCLASILSLSINTNLQAQETTPSIPAIQRTIAPRNTFDKIHIFAKQLRKSVPSLGSNFFETDIFKGAVFNLNGAPEDILDHLSQSEWINELTSVSLVGGHTNSHSILKFLSSASQLEALYLDNFLIEDKNLEESLSDLNRMPNLHTLNLYDNRSVQVLESQFLPTLLSLTPNLRVLELTYNKLGTTDVEGWEHLSKHFPVMHDLHTLILSSNNLGGIGLGGMRALAAILPLMPGLQKLDLTHNSLGGIESEAWKYLSKHFPVMHGLQTLILRTNNLEEIGPDGWHALPAILSRMPDLQMMDLTYNNLGAISAEGWRYLATYFPAMPSFQTLILNFNRLEEIGPDGWRAFAAILSHMPNLRELNLAANNFMEMPHDKWQTFIIALRFLPNLQKLNLNFNLSDELALKVLAEILFQTDSIAGIPNRMHYSPKPIEDAHHYLKINFGTNRISDTTRAALELALADYNPAIKVIF